MAKKDEKSKLEKTVYYGAHGAPELKKDEKNRYLGEFAERVICYLHYEQVIEDAIYPEVIDAIENSEAKKLVISRKVELDQTDEYIKMARKNGLKFKRVDSPEHKGAISLIVASDHAVNVEEKEIPDRKEKLKKLDIPDSIINGVGSKLCTDCWQMLEEKAPEELVNYKKINWLQKLAGEKCVNCDFK